MSGVGAPRKWRPSLGLVVALVSLFLVAAPVIASLTARLTSNQFVRGTETALIAQAALYAESYALAYAGQQPRPDGGTTLTPAQLDRQAARFAPVEPRLKADPDAIAPPRPVGEAASQPPARVYSRISPFLNKLAERTQRVTLAAFQAVDATGQVIASSGGDLGLSYAHLPEIQTALAGEPASILRRRGDASQRHSLKSVSRDTGYRVHVALPVIVEDRVVGAVLLSRTPMDLRKYARTEAPNLARIALAVVLGTALAGWAFTRLLAGPIRDLRHQTRVLADRSQPHPEPLRHYGVRELADLGGSVLDMAAELTTRSDTIESYTAHVTHEMKSPVTAIMGAAELLGSGDGHLTDDQRARLIGTIRQEGDRISLLLARLRELARAKLSQPGATCDLPEVASHVAGGFGRLTVTAQADAPLPLSREQAEILLTQMLQNAADHGAHAVEVTLASGVLRIQDNGRGISAGNRDKVLRPFFTTRRESGGTGMGLSIVEAMLSGVGATLELGASDRGALFVIRFAKPQR